MGRRSSSFVLLCAAWALLARGGVARADAGSYDLSIGLSVGADGPPPDETGVKESGDRDDDAPDRGRIEAALGDSSQLRALMDKPVPSPFALVSRARDDVGRLEAALSGFGYYEGRVSILIDGLPLDDASLLDRLQVRDGPASVRIVARTGPLYRLGTVRIEGDCPPEIARTLSVAPGRPAVAADILAAGAQLLSALQEAGYARARVDPPVAIADDAARTIDVSFPVSAGRPATIGDITILGARDVHEDFIRERLTIHTGDLYRPSRIEAARTDLASLGVFSGVTARTLPDLDGQGRVPLVFDVAERPRHLAGVTAAYSTDLGGMPKISWTDRNLLGSAEQFNLTAQATGLGGNATRGLGYTVNSQLITPDFLMRDQSLQFDLGVLKQNLQAYNQDAVTGGVTLRRKLGDGWSASAGTAVEMERIDQEGTSHRYELVGLPLGIAFDNTGLSNPLFDPTHGLRLAATVAPYMSFGRGDVAFVTSQMSGSTYIDLAGLGLGREGETVIALRGLIGAVQGATQFQLPPDQRFYAGGSGTVRGFSYQSVGPLFADNKPEGGTAVDAATVELRQRLLQDYGFALFVDAGQVSDTNLPFQGVLRVGVGGGVRYYTSIGTVRLDAGVPVNRPAGVDGYQLYLGLGQAF